VNSQVAEDLFGALPASTQKTAPVVSEYKGGDFREFHADKADPNQVTVALGFEMKGGWKDLKNTTALSVLVTLLGGGGSFSAGGPGKGMYSRLYQRVLNRHAWISNCTAFQNGYNDTGLVGLLATCPGDKAGQVVDIMVAEMQVRSLSHSPDSPPSVELWCETPLGEVVKTSHLHLFRRGKTRQVLLKERPHNFSCISTTMMCGWGTLSETLSKIWRFADCLKREAA